MPLQVPSIDDRRYADLVRDTLAPLVTGATPEQVLARPAEDASAPVPTLAQVSAIAQQRCVLCHNAQVQQKNVALHTAELLKQHAQQVYQQASVLKLMPLNNATQITDAERDVIKRWYEAGASIQ